MKFVSIRFLKNHTKIYYSKDPNKTKANNTKNKIRECWSKNQNKIICKINHKQNKKKAPRYEKQYKNKSRQAIHHQTVLKPQPQQSVRIQQNPILEQPPYEEAKFDKKMARTAKPRLQNRSKRIKKRGLTEWEWAFRPFWEGEWFWAASRGSYDGFSL